MSALIKILLDICLLKKGPEDLPASRSLMIFLVVISITVALLLGSYVHDYKIAFLLSTVGIAITFIFAKILLVKRPERFVQTFCANVLRNVGRSYFNRYYFCACNIPIVKR